MKRVIFFVVVVLIVFSMPMCAKASPSSGPLVTINQADFALNLTRNKPEDVLLAIGSAKESSVTISLMEAFFRAEEEIINQMNSMFRNMITDYTVMHEVNPSAALSFQENVHTVINRFYLSGDEIVAEGTDEDGNYFVAVYVSKAVAANEINQAVAAGRLAVPAMAGFNFNDYLDNYFGR